MAWKLLAARLPLPWSLAWRYMRGRRSRMLRSTAAAAAIATTLGVTAMVIAMALMTGYTEDLERKLIGLQGEIIASPPSRLAAQGELGGELRDRLSEVAEVPGVARVGLVAYGEGALSSAALPEGLAVVLRGVDRDDPFVVRSSGDLGGDPGALPGALLGEELARRLGAKRGDVLRLVILDVSHERPRFHYRSIRMAGVFSAGFAEFDSSWVLVDRRILTGARGERFVEMVEVKLAEPAAAEEIAKSIADLLGPEWVVERWQHLNRDLFAALALQKVGLFILLALIVLVSTFNVASTLVILVRERMHDIGVLGSLGMAPRKLWWSFTFYGLLLGGAGILAGVAIGGTVAWVITRYKLVRFGPEIAAIYFIDSVPFRVDPADVAAIVAFSMAVTLAACAVPALKAARVRPSVALRDE